MHDKKGMSGRKLIECIPERRLTLEEFVEIRREFDKNREAEGLALYLACSESYVLHLINETGSLDAVESGIVFNCYRSGDVPTKKRIENALLKKNHALITKAVKEFGSDAFEWEDLIQEAMFAFYNAIIKFEPEKGTKFSTYAYNGMKTQLRRYIIQNETSVSVPVRIYTFYIKVKAMYDLYMALHEDADEDAFAAYALDKMQEDNKNEGVTKADILGILHDAALKRPSSFQAPAYLHSGVVVEMGETVAHPRDRISETIDDVFRTELEELAKRTLDAMELMVIAKAYGVWGEKKVSCGEISKHAGCSLQTVYNKRDIALKKLRVACEKNGITCA